jgi:hypothetical protein
LSFLASQTLPPLNPSTKASPLSRSSRVLKMPSPYEPCIPTPQSLPGPAAWLSPFTGAGLSGLPDLNHSPASSDDSQVSDYFFISRSPEALRPQRSLSLPPTTTLLAEGWTAPRSPSKLKVFLGASSRRVPEGRRNTSFPASGHEYSASRYLGDRVLFRRP